MEMPKKNVTEGWSCGNHDCRQTIKYITFLTRAEQHFWFNIILFQKIYRL